MSVKSVVRKWFVLVIPVVLVLGCSSKKIKVVARVGNELITVEDYDRAYLKVKPVQMARRADFDEKQKFLNQLVDEKLQKNSAYQHRIDQIPEVSERIKKSTERMLYLAVLDDEIVYKKIKEEEIREYYDKSKYEFRARQILLRIPANASQEQIDSTKAIAKKLIQEIRSGTEFSQIAEEYSDDQNTKNRGGDLGYIRWGRLEDPVQRRLFQMRKFQLTDEPVRSKSGFHIIQVTDRRIVPQKPYDIARENIVQSLFQKYRTELIADYNKFNKELEKKRHVVYHDENIDSVIAYYKIPEKDSIYRKNVFTRNPDMNFSWMDPEIKKLGFAVYDGGMVNAADVVRAMFDQGNPVPLRLKNDIKNLVKSVLYYNLTLDLAKRKDYLNESPYKENIEKEINQILTANLKDIMVNKRLDLSEDRLKEYYANHKESFKMEARAEVQEILVESEDLARKIVSWAKAGRSFDDLAEKYNTRSTSKHKKGVLGKIVENSYGLIGKTAFTMQPGEIKGPISSGQKFSVIKVLSREPQRLKTFEEARAEVEARLRQEELKRVGNEWKTKQREEIPVRLFLENLDDVLKDV